MRLRTFVVFAALSILGTVSLQAAQDEPKLPPLPMPEAFDTYYLALYEKGPKHTAEMTPEVQELLVRHIQYQLRLKADGKALASGPLEAGNDPWLGIAILRAASLEEARKIADADPGVQSGRMAAKVYPWNVPAGQLR
jgi:uncharacterized protein YciI